MRNITYKHHGSDYDIRTSFVGDTVSATAFLAGKQVTPGWSIKLLDDLPNNAEARAYAERHAVRLTKEDLRELC